MADTVTTRIKLPGVVHREVKAEAARHGINVDEALGMCVAHLVADAVPLSWLHGKRVKPQMPVVTDEHP